MPAPEPMNGLGALAEAQRRWGERGAAWRGPRRECCVGLEDDDGKRTLFAAGESWETALAGAERPLDELLAQSMVGVPRARVARVDVALPPDPFVEWSPKVQAKPARRARSRTQPALESVPVRRLVADLRKAFDKWLRRARAEFPYTLGPRRRQS